MYVLHSAESDSEEEEDDDKVSGDEDDDDVPDDEDEEPVKPAAKASQKQPYVSQMHSHIRPDTVINITSPCRKKSKIQTPSNGEDLVEDMDLADFENSDDEEMESDE